jgi:hypothetical protein
MAGKILPEFRGGHARNAAVEKWLVHSEHDDLTKGARRATNANDMLDFINFISIQLGVQAALRGYPNGDLA